jgi:hypothetical protein
MYPEIRAANHVCLGGRVGTSLRRILFNDAVGFVMNDRTALQAEIAHTVAAVRGGEQEHAVARLSRLTDAADQVMRESVLELVGANVEMLHSAVDGAENLAVRFAVAGENDEELPVSIDEFEPAQRAATRIMLALASNRREDADIQLDIVGAAPGSSEMGLVFVHTLCWTIELLDVCQEVGSEIPVWLRPVLA